MSNVGIKDFDRDSQGIATDAIWLDEKTYMNPVGIDETTGCTMYSPGSTLPGRATLAAIYYRAADGSFILDKNLAYCPQ